jgi:hypothetical protein
MATYVRALRSYWQDSLGLAAEHSESDNRVRFSLSVTSRFKWGDAKAGASWSALNLYFVAVLGHLGLEYREDGLWARSPGGAAPVAQGECHLPSLSSERCRVCAFDLSYEQRLVLAALEANGSREAFGLRQPVPAPLKRVAAPPAPGGSSEALPTLPPVLPKAAAVLKRVEVIEEEEEEEEEEDKKPAAAEAAKKNK